MVTVKTEWWLWIVQISKLYPAILFLSWGHREAEKVPWLHLLSGLDKPSSGSLTYDGKDIYSYSDKELSAFRRKRIGFIFQQFNLLPVLTAKENIIMPLLLDKQKPDEAYLKQLAELLGLQAAWNICPMSYPAASSSV